MNETPYRDTTFSPALGTVVKGTTQPRQVLPKVYMIAHQIEPVHVDQRVRELGLDGWMELILDSYQEEGDGPMTEFEEQRGDEIATLWDFLFDKLTWHSPDGIYFGAAEGDDTDYGFWRESDRVDDGISLGDLANGQTTVEQVLLGRIPGTNEHRRVDAKFGPLTTPERMTELSQFVFLEEWLTGDTYIKVRIPRAVDTYGRVFDSAGKVIDQNTAHALTFVALCQLVEVYSGLSGERPVNIFQALDENVGLVGALETGRVDPEMTDEVRAFAYKWFDEHYPEHEEIVRAADDYDLKSMISDHYPGGWTSFLIAWYYAS